MDRTLAVVTVVDLLDCCDVVTSSCSPVDNSEVSSSTTDALGVSTVKDKGKDWVLNNELGKLTDSDS